MIIVDSRTCTCACCMEEHDVKIVRVKERTSFKNKEIEYDAVYYYCDVADELYMDEKMIGENDLKMKDEYRKSEGLLTSYQISAIRRKYGISQSELCILLGWGAKTITRYESHQIQDRAHNVILEKIDNDPEWFISLLKKEKDSFTEAAYNKYLNAARVIYEKDKDLYLRKAIEAKYMRFADVPAYTGNTELSLDKVVEVIRFFAASDDVTNLYKVKLMKLLWYADSVAFRQRKRSMTGLVYLSFPMGALPAGHNMLTNLSGVPCKEVELGENCAYHFALMEPAESEYLSAEEEDILSYVAEKLGHMSTKEMTQFMHNEKAYVETEPGSVIPFSYADSLQI